LAIGLKTSPLSDTYAAIYTLHPLIAFCAKPETKLRKKEKLKLSPPKTFNFLMGACVEPSPPQGQKRFALKQVHVLYISGSDATIYPVANWAEIYTPSFFLSRKILRIWKI
jgi:hypothetical protein